MVGKFAEEAEWRACQLLDAGSDPGTHVRNPDIPELADHAKQIPVIADVVEGLQKCAIFERHCFKTGIEFSFVRRNALEPSHGAPCSVLAFGFDSVKRS